MAQVGIPPDHGAIRVIYAKIAKGEKAPEGVMGIEVSGCATPSYTIRSAHGTDEPPFSNHAHTH